MVLGTLFVISIGPMFNHIGSWENINNYEGGKMKRKVREPFKNYLADFVR